MKFTNYKTCQGIETFLRIAGVWVRLSELPELLRSVKASDANRILSELEKQLESVPSR